MVAILDIIHRDEAIVAVNKPSGLLVHRSGLAADRVTCMSLLRDQLGEWVYPVHRLDRGASGVLLFALDRTAAAIIARQFADRSAAKRYVAVVRGWAPEAVVVDYPLDDDELPGSQRVEATTSFRRLAFAELPSQVGRYQTARSSLVEALPETGRRHQIRRHLAHLRHPIIGDAVHGDGRHNRFFRDELGVDRLLLHGCSLSFSHPLDGSRVVLRAAIPEDFTMATSRLGWSDPTRLLSID